MTTSSRDDRSLSRRGRSAVVDAHDHGRNLPLATSLPLGVLAIGIAGYLGVVGSFWIAFGGVGETALVLVIVSLFGAMYFGLPYVMARTAAKHAFGERKQESIADFLAGDFDTLTGRIGGWSAMVQYALLPVALAFGALTIGIIMMVLR
jgi:hypothetical protein